MASEKISDMPAAAAVGNADLIPIVQALANLRATRLQLLTAALGELIALVGNAGASVTLGASGDISVRAGGAEVKLTSAGAVAITCAAGHSFTLSDASLAYITTDGAGTLALQGSTAASLAIHGSGSIVNLLASGLVQLTSQGNMQLKTLNGTNPDVQYVPAVAPIWAGVPPGKLNVAIDRIANLLFIMHGGPIP